MDRTMGEIEVVTAEEIKELSEIEEVQLVDVQTTEERRESLLDNSQNIDFNSPTFDKEIEKLDKSKPVIVYCKSWEHFEQCTKKMKDAGYVKIYDLDKGKAKWKFRGYDIEITP
jgi:rhodanese-related sulfurtransferase